MPLLAVVAARCEGLPEDSCVARGTRTDIHGQLASTMTIGGNTPVLATTAETMTISDYDHSCSYEQKELPVELLGCRVFVRLEPADQHVDDPDPVPAVVVGGQTCTLALPQGQVRLSIASGTLAFPGGVPTFTLDAGVGAVDGVSALGAVHLALTAE